MCLEDPLKSLQHWPDQCRRSHDALAHPRDEWHVSLTNYTMTYLFTSLQLLVNDGSANFEARRVFEDPYATSYYETALNDVVSLDVDSDGDQVRSVLTEGKETQTARGVLYSSFVTRFNIDSSPKHENTTD